MNSIIAFAIIAAIVLGSMGFGVFGVAQNENESAGAGGWKQVVRDNSA